MKPLQEHLAASAWPEVERVLHEQYAALPFSGDVFAIHGKTLLLATVRALVELRDNANQPLAVQDVRDHLRPDKTIELLHDSRLSSQAATHLQSALSVLQYGNTTLVFHEQYHYASAYAEILLRDASLVHVHCGGEFAAIPLPDGPIGACIKALHELVELKAMKARALDESEMGFSDQARETLNVYAQRKELAWQNARGALADVIVLLQAGEPAQ